MLTFCFLTPKTHIRAPNHVVGHNAWKSVRGPWQWGVGRTQ